MTPEDARRRFESLRAMVAVVRGPKLTLNPQTVLKLDDVERELLAAMERNRGPGPARDGYPSGAPGLGGEYAPKSTTEGAMLSRYRLANKDHVEQSAGWFVEWETSAHHQYTTEAEQALKDMDDALDRLLKRLEAIRNHSKPPPKHSNPGGDCLVCGRHVEGTENDRLRRGMCDTDYRAWRRHDKPDLTPRYDEKGDPVANDNGVILYGWPGREHAEAA